MNIRFWGVRGSFPVSSPDVIRYGGNTPCIEVDTGDGLLVIDAGTGIRGLGKALLERGARRVDLLLSHAHWDHIQGFPHFEPLYDASVTVTVHALRHPRHRLATIFAEQQQEPFYPVGLQQLAASLDFVEREDGETFAAAGASVTCRRLNHPGVTGGFRIEAGGRTFAYISDTDVAGERLLADDLPDGEAADPGAALARLRRAARDLGHNADLLVCDTFFLADDYDPSWGHSRAEDFVEFAADVGAGRMCLFHHRPSRSDDELDTLVERLAAGAAVPLTGAREGLEIAL